MTYTEQEIDDMMRVLFDNRTQSRHPVTDEAWARRKVMFRASNAVLREDAIRELDNIGDEW